MKTIFGKALAKIRLDNNLSLKEMAENLGVPSSYLSAVESGSKNLTPDFLDKIVSYLCLQEKDEIDLRNAAALSTGEWVIDTSPLPEQNIRTLAMFAKRLADLTDHEREKINEILRRGG